MLPEKRRDCENPLWKWVFDVKTDAGNYILNTELDGLSIKTGDAKDWILITPTL
jgi:hypothetical protein